MDETAQSLPQEGVNNGGSELNLQQPGNQEQPSGIPSSNTPSGDTSPSVGSGLSETRESEINSSSGGSESREGTLGQATRSTESLPATSELPQSESSSNIFSEGDNTSGTIESISESAGDIQADNQYPTQAISSTSTGPTSIQAEDISSEITGSQSGAPFYKRLKPIHYLIGVVIALAVVASVAARPAIAPSSAPTATLNTTGCVVPSLTQKMPVASSSGTSSEHTR